MIPYVERWVMGVGLITDLPSLKTVRLTGGHFLNVGSFVFESEKRWRLL